MLDANINKKELTYGPVTLAYVEGKPVQSISGSNSMAESKSKVFLNNLAALKEAKILSDSGHLILSISDDDSAIYEHPEIIRKVEEV